MANIGGHDPAYTSFDGLSVTVNSVLIKFTYYGDTDLDGIVENRDINRILGAFSSDQSVGPTDERGWANGESDFSGTVDMHDVNLAQEAFGSQSADAIVLPSDPKPPPVPEPARALLAAIGAVGMIFVRCRYSLATGFSRRGRHPSQATGLTSVRRELRFDRVAIHSILRHGEIGDAFRLKLPAALANACSTRRLRSSNCRRTLLLRNSRSSSKLMAGGTAGALFDAVIFSASRRMARLTITPSAARRKRIQTPWIAPQSMPRWQSLPYFDPPMISLNGAKSKTMPVMPNARRDAEDSKATTTSLSASRSPSRPL